MSYHGPGPALADMQNFVNVKTLEQPRRPLTHHTSGEHRGSSHPAAEVRRKQIAPLTYNMHIEKTISFYSFFVFISFFSIREQQPLPRCTYSRR